MADTEIPAAEVPKPRAFEEITLEQPITRGETTIDKLQIRKPKAGQLRGLNLNDIINSDITAMLTLIPRITMPPITSDEANELDPADLSEIGGTIRGFFMTAAERELMATILAAHQPKT